LKNQKGGKSSNRRAPSIAGKGEGSEVLFERSEFAERALFEKRRAARRAASYGRFLLVPFSFTRKKMNKMLHDTKTLQV
jgi:hypothetical protein